MVPLLTWYFNRFSNNPKGYSMKQIFLVICALLVSSFTFAAADFKEGVDYKKVENAKPGKGDSVEIIEFFNYACPHCKNLDPFIEEWRKSDKPESVSFKQVPVFWNSLYENTAKAYHTAEYLKISEKMHPIIFEAIHEKNVNFEDEAAIKNLFVENGVDGKEFDKKYNSFYVKQNLALGSKQFQNYKLKSVPVFVVDGQWEVSLQTAQTHQRLFKILNYLAERSAK